MRRPLASVPGGAVLVAGALSVEANVAHADGADPLARALVAVPPVALLAAAELGAWQLRRAPAAALASHRPVVVVPVGQQISAADVCG